MTETRTWWKEAVVYQIYPRSFSDSNGDGIGDLQGIRQRLPYLKALGVDALWLCPIYASPNDDNGYDISDYQAIMTDFGTMADFDALLADAHSMGIRIVMDLVMNHTSDEHAWFVASRKSRDNPYRDYYIWRDGRDGAEPNNWGSRFSGSAWTYDEATGQYYLHFYTRRQPDLNWANPAVCRAMFDMIDWWCRKGVDGFRLDSIGTLGKESFEDGPVAEGKLYGDFWPRCNNKPSVHTILSALNREVLDRYDLLTVGETDDVTPEIAVQYAGGEHPELKMCFQFDHTSLGRRGSNRFGACRFTLGEFRAALNRWQTELEGRAWNALYLTNHDQPRAVSRFGNDHPLFRERSAKMLATLLHMMKGTPYVYQGEELGMTNAYFTSIDDYQDVATRNAWRQWVESGRVDAQDMLLYNARMSRDNSRTPMQWDDSPNAGFTTGTPWIAVNENYHQINAARQMNDPDSVFSYYRALIRLRHEHDIVVYGTFEPLLTDDPAVYAYRRHLNGQTLTVLCNFTAEKAPCALLCEDNGRELLSNYATHQQGLLQPYEAIILLRD